MWIGLVAGDRPADRHYGLVSAAQAGNLTAAFHLVGFIEVIDTEIEIGRKTLIKTKSVACKEPTSNHWSPNITHSNIPH
jgi:hypothetical protein